MSDNSSGRWYAKWFNTPFYHVLYGHRDDKEASVFIERLTVFLYGAAAGEERRVLDLACGSGRHVRSFYALGFKVWGVDLSEASIEEASERGPAEISYTCQDMRNFSLPGKFDLITNLFTSFGYFEREDDNRDVLKSVARHLKPDGLFVLDFMNVHRVLKHLVHEETIDRQGISFHVTRKHTGRHIVKTIKFNDNRNDHAFNEQVQSFSLDQLTQLLFSTGFNLEAVFGDYNLSNFELEKSPRAILIARLK